MMRRQILVAMLLGAWCCCNAKNGKGDFLMFQLRLVDDSWKVVAELLD